MKNLEQHIEPEAFGTETEDERKRVKDEIGLARQMCSQMGNNDSEFDYLNDIWDRFNEGRLTAEQAITAARKIPENKIQR